MSQVVDVKDLTEPESGPPTMLLVDDEAHVLDALRRLFRAEKYNVLTATSGADGLESLRENDIDLIISDMRMPGMMGDEFLRQASELFPETQRILLTGYADLDSAVSAINSGHIYSYQTKPWDNQALKLAVSQALHLKHLSDENIRLGQLTREQNEILKVLNNQLEDKVAKRTKELTNTLNNLKESHEKLKTIYEETINVFAQLVELREGQSAIGCQHIAKDALKLAIHFDLSQKERLDVYYAALLQGIGQIGLSNDLTDNALLDLSEEEQKQFYKHAVYGEMALVGLELLHDSAKLIRYQYERPDGSGFPDGLVQGKIPLGSSIIAVVRDYYLLQKGKLKNKLFKPKEAKEILIKYKKKRYHPDVVDAFLSIIQKDGQQRIEVTERTLNSKEIKPGMMLSRDLRTSTGMLLLSKGHALTDNVIKRIRTFEKDEGIEFDICVDFAKRMK